ncbi:rhodanese-like domain-containing protein [Actinomadura sp. KC216]|uniref:rhodanese-like domain-containing protein n=1 Tax=Actinomadura sp. KC216 TaxID=2530370 RepID=UPI001FB792E8|nr:rhodanese-like domain-containing protein [Actinomadura sp. KC216]
MTTPPLPAILDAATLRRLLDTGDAPRLIDVRTPGEFETTHIPGSHNVPLGLLREHRAELRAHLDEPAVLICHSGQRAAQAAQALAAADPPNLRVLHGGISAWQAAGGTVATGRPRWAWNARSAWSPVRLCWAPYWPAPSSSRPNGSPRSAPGSPSRR